MKRQKEYAVIVAAGTGTRMNSNTPKQFLKLGTRPVLMHTLLAFFNYSADLELVLVLPEPQMKKWSTRCRALRFKSPVKIVKGGITRFQSVKNGLLAIGDQGLVAIHDGVRPLVEKEIIAASFQIASLHGSAVASVRLKESLRETDNDMTRAVDRSRFRVIQTPQTFQIPLIRKAYETKEEPGFTDDAMVAENAGFRISLFEGSYMNIKITTPEDLLVAKALLQVRSGTKSGMK